MFPPIRFKSFLDLEKLTEEVANSLLEHVSSEAPVRNAAVDQALLGLLGLLEKVMEVNEVEESSRRRYSKEVFSRCLFSVSTSGTETAKCKSQESRKAAFRLLLALEKPSACGELVD